MNEQDLVNMLKARYGVVKEASGNWVRIPCPTCTAKDRKKMKRYISKQHLGTKCFICNVYLTIEEILGDYNFPVANYEKPTTIAKPKEEHPWAKRMPGREFVPLNRLAHDHPAAQFLHNDHLYDFDRYYEENGIVYCPADAGVIITSKPFVTSAERLIFPVTFRGEMIGWQMRSIPGTIFGDRKDVIKYYHLFDKGNYLYNYDNAKKYSMVVLTEGVKKTLKFFNGVASLGKGLTPIQIQMLQEWDYVTIFLDSEESTQLLARQITAAINAGPKTAININPGKYGFPSPDEATKEQLEEILINEWGNKKQIPSYSM